MGKGEGKNQLSTRVPWEHHDFTEICTSCDVDMPFNHPDLCTSCDVDIPSIHQFGPPRLAWAENNYLITDFSQILKMAIFTQLNRIKKMTWKGGYDVIIPLGIYFRVL